MSDLSQPGAHELLVHELLDAMAVPAWLYRPGLPLQANPALQRLCGLSRDGLQQRPHLDLVVADDRDVLAAATDACLQGSGDPPAQSLRLRSADGNERPVELTLRRVAWQGQTGALVTCIDHSDFMHVQNMLQSMSGLLRQIVDGAPVASFVIDRFHRVTHWNTACAQLTGCTAEQMIGSTEPWRAFYEQARPMLADLIVDGAAEHALQAHYGGKARRSDLLAGAYEAEDFFPRLGADGLWLAFTAAPLRGQDHQVSGAIVTLQDVSQRRRTESELTRRLEILVEERSAELAAHARVVDAFIDNASMGVVYARGSTVLRSNRRMVDIFGPAPTGSRRGSGDFYLSSTDIDALRRVATPLLAQGRPVHHEMWLHDAQGRPIWVQVNAYVVDLASVDTGIWWMLQDRSEVRAAQEELRSRFEQLQATNQKLEQAQNQLLQSDKMASIGQLAAGVAHEINNPVGFVSSNLNTLRQYVDALMQLVDAQAGTVQAPHDASLRAKLASVQKAVELDYLREDLPQLLDESAEGLARVKKIVEDLKDFSRVDQADWQQADLNAGLESTLNVVRNEVKYKAEVLKQLSPLPRVTCLAGQLNQVFMNLLVNAAHAISGHGTITLSTGHQDGWVWVQVDDTGCGMSDEVRRRIFEPFFTTKDVGKGTGLGLSLSYGIVQRHGGALLVRSTPGSGSQFRLWVPVDGPASAPGAAVGATPASPPAWD
jgi:two-component system, NtrC family, sensor kinase